MDIIDLMRADHRALDSLLAELVCTGIDRRSHCLSRVAANLRLNVRVEEEIFYPAFRDVCRHWPDRDLFLEALYVHCQAGELLLGCLEALPPGDPAFADLARQLRDTLRQHHAREHHVIFARARRLLPPGQLCSQARAARRMRGAPLDTSACAA